MAHYRVICYRNQNSLESNVERIQKVIQADTLHGAKMQASRDFPIKGKWAKLANSNSYIKVRNGDPLQSDKLYLIPI